MHYADGVLHIASVSALELARRFGTPLYAYDAGVIRRQVERVMRAFSGLPFQPFYAMKANSNLAVLRVVHQSGFGADAVSPGEIFLAKHAGFTSEEIWFTCSNVSDEDLRAIGDPRIVINLNSMSEVDRILSLGLPNPVALRVNPDVGAGHHTDVVTAGGGVKFGIDLAEVDQARMVVEDSGRKVVGLHAHIGSGVDTIAPLLESARRLLELSTTFGNLRWLNFGGGMSVPYRPGDKDFPIDDYGAELTHVAERLLRARDLTAILEPGRYVVAQAGILLARVTAKRLSAGAFWIGCDTGFNHLVRPSKYGAYHHIVNARQRGTQEALVVAGNLCESGDIFTLRDEHDRPVPRLMDATQVGDVIGFCDAGAYGFSMASNYNARLLPAEVLVDGADVRVIRERQKLDDLIRGMQ
jgi:diaminopimelate decarboxylase